MAPALLVVAVGLWRNVCPLASTALFSRHMGFSKRIKLTETRIGQLNLIAVIALFTIVPLRHAIFDMNGMATAILLIAIAVIAIIAGLLTEWKSGWCSGLCPVHPVEKLYGINNKFSLPNAHCNQCFRCVTPCPDSTPADNPLSLKKTAYHKIASFLMVAAFPGFVWGWFQVPDYPAITSAAQLISIYKTPLIGSLVSMILFVVLNRYVREKLLVGIFSASAVSFYYWFRIPALLGFGVFPGDGMLVDLSASIPEWSMYLTTVITTVFFFYWIVLSKQQQQSWSIRPKYAKKEKKVSAT
ncbi:MAG: hypothetical protein QF371_02595 [Flavobacteriales bacterium]|nr:hypothetical protein [Flavobacteriales bacterium]